MTEAPSKTFTSIPLEEIRQDVNEDLPESREANSEVNENTIARPVLPSMMKKDYEELNLTLGQKITRMLNRERVKARAYESIQERKISEPEPEKCDCQGESECNKKINYLQNKLRYLMNNPYTKQVSQIYDIEGMGVESKSYLVEYTDNSLEKVSVKFIKKHHLESYVQFLERNCFG